MAINKKLIFWNNSSFNPPTSSTDTTQDVLWNTIVFFGPNSGHQNQIWTHGVYFSSIWGTETADYVPVTISGVTKNLSLNGHTHSYLPLSGGTLTNSVFLPLNIPAIRFGNGRTWDSAIGHDNYGYEVEAFMTKSASTKYRFKVGFDPTTFAAGTFTNMIDADLEIGAGYCKIANNTVWHAGNFTPGNYLQLSGGTMTGPIIKNNEILNLAQYSIGDGTVTGMIDIVLPNTNWMGDLYITIQDYETGKGGILRCQIYTYYGSSTRFEGANSVTWTGGTPTFSQVRYVTVGSDNYAVRHILIGTSSTQWNYSNIWLSKAVQNPNYASWNTSVLPTISLITADPTILDTSLNVIDFYTYKANLANSADMLDNQHGTYYLAAENFTGTLPSSILGNSSLYIGTTSISLNRTSASQTLTGVSIDGNATNADKLDGQEGVYYHNNVGNIDFATTFPAGYTINSETTATTNPYSIIGGSQATILQVMPGDTNYGAQFAIGFGTAYPAWRSHQNSSTWSPWQKISAGYADNSGLLNNMSASTSVIGNTIAQRDSSGNLYAGNLYLTNSTAGLFKHGSDGILGVTGHLYPKDTTMTQNIGSPDYKWNTVYANSFVGNLTGSASQLDSHNASDYEQYYSYNADLSSLSSDYYWGVRVVLNDRWRRYSIRVDGDQSATAPFSDRGDSLIYICFHEHVTPSSWSGTIENRIIYNYSEWGGSGSQILGNVKQYTNSSSEMFYLRGGAKYKIWASGSVSVSVLTSDLTIASQTIPCQILLANAVSPTTWSTGTGFYLNQIVGNITSANKVNSTLTFTGYSTQTFNGSSNVSVAIPNNTNQLTNGAGFLTAITKAQVEAVLTGAITSHTHNFINSNDSRDIVTTPETINQGLTLDFKASSNEGLIGEGAWMGELTYRIYGWGTDWNGGPSHQLAFASTGNLWHRIGSSTTWNSWYKIWDSNNSNLTTIPWSVSTLTMNGALTGATTGSFSGLLSSYNNQIIGAGGTNDAYLEFWRGTNASWKLLSSGGILYFQSNFTSVVGNYYDAMTLSYNSGDMWVKGNVTAPNFIGNLNGIASTVSNGVYTNTDQTITGTKYFTSTLKTYANSNTGALVKLLSIINGSTELGCISSYNSGSWNQDMIFSVSDGATPGNVVEKLRIKGSGGLTTSYSITASSFVKSGSNDTYVLLGGGGHAIISGLNVATASVASQIISTVSGTNSIELVRGNMADNDQFRILVGGTASNEGYVEIATADDATEPIYVRQYGGVFEHVARSATLLDASGNTSFPGSVTANGFIGTATNADTVDNLHADSFMRATTANGYYGLAVPGGGDSNWIRTTQSGIIPYQPGGYSSLGTDSWPFSSIYSNNYYGSGASLTSLNASNISSGTIGNDRLPQRLINYTSQYWIDPNFFKDNGFAFTSVNLPANVGDANILGIFHTSGGWGHQLAFKFSGGGTTGSGYDGKDIYTRLYNQDGGAWTPWYTLLSSGNYNNILNSTYRSMGGSWAGNNVPGTREFGYTTNDGSGEVAFKSNSGTMNMIIDGTIYVTDSSYEVIHAGNIGSQSVNYANTSGSSGSSNVSYKLWTTSHPNNWYLSSIWDGGYFQLKARSEDSFLPVNVDNASNATNISNTGTVTLASATESNAITITQPSYATDQPVKLLNFNWYTDAWSIGNIRSGNTPSNGLGIFLNSVEKFRFINGVFKIGTNTAYHAGNFSVTLNGTSTTSAAFYAPTSQLSVQSSTPSYLIGASSTTSLGTVYSNAGIYMNGSKLYTGDIQSSGNITAYNVWNTITITKNLTVGVDWMDTGIDFNTTNFPDGDGTYAIEIYTNASSVNSIYYMRYSGVIPIYTGDTNSTDSDEISLTSGGHATNSRRIYARIQLQEGHIYSKLQIACSHAWTGAGDIIFKFKKLI